MELSPELIHSKFHMLERQINHRRRVKVNTCESSRPPTTAMPSGRRNSEPVPMPSASGTAPSSAAMVVIMMGRKRTMQAL